MNTLTPRTDEQHGWQERLKYPQYLPTVPAEFARQLERELAEAKAYADKLADGLPEGMLPKDVEVLREANAGLAAENETLRAEVTHAEQRAREEYGRNLEGLFAKVRELEADKARLDWLLENPTAVPIKCNGYYLCVSFPIGRGETARQAIDAARNP